MVFLHGINDRVNYLMLPLSPLRTPGDPCGMAFRLKRLVLL